MLIRIDTAMRTVTAIWAVLLNVVVLKIRFGRCDSVYLYGDRGTILSPNYPNNYPRSFRRYYYVTPTTPGPRQVRLDYIIDVYKDPSRVRCRHGVWWNNQYHCGTISGTDYIYVSGTLFWVYFWSSSYTSVSSGFNITYSALGASCCTSDTTTTALERTTSQNAITSTEEATTEETTMQETATEEATTEEVTTEKVTTEETTTEETTTKAATTEEATTEEVTTVEAAATVPTSSPKPVTYSREQCHCACVWQEPPPDMNKPLTPEKAQELAEEKAKEEEKKVEVVKEITKNLTVSKFNTSASTRRYSSAVDERPSSKYMGIAVGSVCFLPLVVIVLADCFAFLLAVLRKVRACFCSICTCCCN